MINEAIANTYVCSKCNNLDNMSITQPFDHGDVQLCHRCIHGKWHGFFKEEKYVDFETNGPVRLAPKQ